MIMSKDICVCDNFNISDINVTAVVSCKLNIRGYKHS